MADNGGDGQAAEAPQPAWDVLPEAAAQCVLHFLTSGHAKVARLACRAWRDTLDGQARHARLPGWPGSPSHSDGGGSGGSGSGSGSGGGGGGGGARPPAEARLMRPLHEIAPNLTAVDLSPLPVDDRGGQLAALFHDLARLTGLTELQLGLGALATHEVAIAVGSSHAAFDRSFTCGLAVKLPDEISILTGLRSLSIAGDDLPDNGSSALDHRFLECAPQLPPALAALGALTALSVGALVLPRRQLHMMSALRSLRLAGWSTVTKMAVHLHKLASLQELSLSVDEVPEEGAAGHLLTSVLGELVRVRPLKRLRLTWQQTQPPALEDVPDGALDRALAAHAHSLESLDTNLFCKAPLSTLAPLGRLTRLESLALRGFPCSGDELGLVSWPARVLPAGLARLTALEVEDFCDCGCSSRPPLSFGGLPRLEMLRIKVDGFVPGHYSTLPDDLAACTALRVLALDVGGLEELPPWLTGLAGLEELSFTLMFSRAAAPPWLSSLSRLTHLSFECSEHGEQPGFLHAMSRLHELLLSGPVLGDAIEADGSPGQGGHGADLLPGLRTVAVRGPLSNLQAHPERAAAAAVQWLASRRFLVDLAAAGSYLGPTLEALPEGLERLRLYDNGVGQLPDSLSRLVDLEELSVCANQLTGVPHGITRLHCLRDLELVDCQIKALPRDMSRLVCLECLNVSGNRALRALPPCLGGAPALRRLELVDTAVTALPPEWAAARGGALPALADLNLPRAARRGGVAQGLRARGVAVYSLPVGDRPSAYDSWEHYEED